MNRSNVGIVTLPGHFNYGNRLQCYAVSQIYNKCGLSSEELVLAPRFRIKRTAIRFARKLLNIERVNPEDMMSEARKAAFDRFDSRVQSRIIERLDSCLIDEYDLFSVGSDQTWNPSQYAYNEDWFFLQFARPEQRIALAPSLGVDSVTRRQSRQIERGVRDFPALSVREDKGAEIIRKCSGRESAVICDPTLVLSPDEWRNVSDARLTPCTPYVLTYLLGGIGADAGKVLNCVTNQGKLPVISLSDREKPEEPPAGPSEFISLIDGASHVVTDSFHAAVFSCVLQTPLTIVHRGGGSKLFSRLETLAQSLEITHKIYGHKDFDISRAGDYREVPKAIRRERCRFMCYLENCLDNQFPIWRDDACA